MTEHGEWRPASPKRRAAARAIDTVVTVALALAALMVAGFAAAFVTLLVLGFGSTDNATLYVWLILFSLLALIPVARYEVTAIARRGQTLGKKTMGLRVVGWDDKTAAPVGGAESLGTDLSIQRWAVPHGAGLLAGVVAGAASAPMIGAYGLLVGADMWLVVSAVIYLSALGDPHRRGWHDKFAGTAVVEAAPAHRGDPTDETPHRHEPRPPRPRRGVMLIMMCAAVAGGVMVGGAVFGAIEAVSSISGSEIDQDDQYDKYDEATRQRHDFGQRVGPDGDACWPEKRNKQSSGFIVACDLESIGGLHWDTGDVSTHRDYFYIGSGYMCLLRIFSNRPWCWEWSSDVQPRLARAPQDWYLDRIVTADGFVCGQRSDYVTCWTVGVDQQTYQQDSHSFRDGSGWVLKEASDDSFYVQQEGTTQGMWLPAFTEDEQT